MRFFQLVAGEALFVGLGFEREQRDVVRAEEEAVHGGLAGVGLRGGAAGLELEGAEGAGLRLAEEGVDAAVDRDRGAPALIGQGDADFALGAGEHDLTRLRDAAAGVALFPHEVGEPAGEVADGVPVRGHGLGFALQLGLMLFEPRRDVPGVGVRGQFAAPRLARGVGALEGAHQVHALVAPGEAGIGLMEQHAEER